MNNNEWRKLKEKDPEKYREEYIDFMYNKSNIGKCDICPANDSDEYRRDPLPCGQYHCWVQCHCDF